MGKKANQMSTKVILTIPHAKCNPNDKSENQCDPQSEHSCDYTALHHAKVIKSYLEWKKIKPIVLIGDINRSIIDLNRNSAQNTKFHKRLDKLLNDNPKVILLDIHSGCFEPQIELTLLDLNNRNDDLLITMFRDFFQTSILKGSDENYIVKKAHNYNLQALLIEFNENHEYTDDFYDELSEIIKEIAKL